MYTCYIKYYIREALHVMWFTNNYRRNLVDMHIEDWNPEFLSEFSVDDYYNNLVKGKIQSPMIYLQSHVGHCYWDTKTGHMHKALVGREDLIKQLIDKCRADGMAVVGYYSLIYNTYEEDRHPEWKLLNRDGKSARDNGGRYGLCCPNNMEYRKFVFAQIAEMLDYFELDGMFYDMLFWPYTCYCDSCRERYKNETGFDIPNDINWNDTNWMTFYHKRYEWMGEFAMSVTKETKRINPNLSVEHNYASGVAGDWHNGAGELVNEACDYTGGDLYGDLYNHSFTCKYYINITNNPPFEYMTCRCANNLQQHTITKTKEALELEIMLTCAHHGASFIIDAIDPKGTMDSRVYDRIGEIFTKQMQYEPYFKGDHIADVAVYYSTVSRFNPDGQNFDSKSCSVNLIKTLTEFHVPSAVLSNGCLDKMNNYKFIFAPSVFDMSDDIADRFINYVNNGGNLYISGITNVKLLKSLLNIEYSGNLTKETRTYIAPVDEFNADYPLPVDYRLPLMKTYDKDIAAYIKLPYTARSDKQFASIHSDPPGKETDYPALIIRKYGKGNVIWSAAPIEIDTRIQYKRILMNLMNKYLPVEDYSVSADTSKNVEIVSFKTDTGYLVSVVDLTCSEELVPVRSFKIKIKCGKPKSINKLPDKLNVDYKYTDGILTFTADEFALFDMYEVEI